MEKKQTKPIIEFNDYISEQRNDFINYNLILATSIILFIFVYKLWVARAASFSSINSSFLIATSLAILLECTR